MFEHAVISLQPGQELEIFYPVPFASPPNLELSNMHPPESKIVIVDQQSDRFRIRNESNIYGPTKLTWHARGVRLAGNVPAPPPNSPSAFPPTPAPITSTGVGAASFPPNPTAIAPISAGALPPAEPTAIVPTAGAAPPPPPEAIIPAGGVPQGAPVDPAPISPQVPPLPMPIR